MRWSVPCRYRQKLALAVQFSWGPFRTSNMADRRCVTSPENPSFLCIPSSTRPSPIIAPSHPSVSPWSGRGHLTRSPPANQQGRFPLAERPGASPWREVGMTTTQIDTDRSLLHIMGLWREGGKGWERGQARLCQSRERENGQALWVVVIVVPS